MNWLIGMLGWAFGVLAFVTFGQMLGRSWAATMRDGAAGGVGLGRVQGRRQGLLCGPGGAMDCAGALFAAAFFGAIALASFMAAHSTVATMATSAIVGVVLMVCAAIDEGRTKRRRPK